MGYKNIVENTRFLIYYYEIIKNREIKRRIVTEKQYITRTETHLIVDKPTKADPEVLDRVEIPLQLVGSYEIYSDPVKMQTYKII